MTTSFDFRNNLTYQWQSKWIIYWIYTTRFNSAQLYATSIGTIVADNNLQGYTSLTLSKFAFLLVFSQFFVALFLCCSLSLLCDMQINCAANNDIKSNSFLATRSVYEGITFCSYSCCCCCWLPPLPLLLLPASSFDGCAWSVPCFFQAVVDYILLHFPPSLTHFASVLVFYLLCGMLNVALEIPCKSIALLMVPHGSK